ncbi:DUF4249 family protein [Maribacter sp. 2210JD10-5]|uniref:DUF4249 family protein n=1 Tax=Maribacter sp. 2210JD10-5 TaxID=3386272 RepID=UPI0039BCD4EB
MKTYIKLMVLFFTITACEDVIEVPVQTAPSRLVVEASLDWEKGTSGNVQTIKLSTSTSFFNTDGNTAVTGASVQVTNDTDGTVFLFTDQNDGTYLTESFIPIIGASYTLNIIHDGETYNANETLNAVPELTEIYQAREDGFDEEKLEVHLVFTDPAEEGNAYLFKFQKEGELLPDLEVANDKFINGKEIDWWYEIEEDEDTEEIEVFEPGDIVNIEFYGISEAYNDYIEILISQLGGVGLFEAVPVAVKGNCINVTNPENYAHGYFRVTEVVKASYTFVED